MFKPGDLAWCVLRYDCGGDIPTYCVCHAYIREALERDVYVVDGYGFVYGRYVKASKRKAQIAAVRANIRAMNKHIRMHQRMLAKYEEELNTLKGGKNAQIQTG